MKRYVLVMSALFVILAASADTGSYTSTSGHWLYFENRENVWSQVWLRIGRGDHVYSKAFTPIAGTSWWKCEAPDYANYTHFTITDSSDATAPVTPCPAGSNRIYEYSYDINCDHWFTINPNGAHSDGSVTWWETTDTREYPQIINSEAGHQIWFDNSVCGWENVYLRIGRSEVTGYGQYTSTWPMTHVEGSDLWYVNTENWSNAEAWTITDTDANNGDDYAPFDLPSNANRLYFYNYSIDGYIMYVVDGSSAAGVDDAGVYYWANHGTTDAPVIPGCTNCFVVTR